MEAYFDESTDGASERVFVVAGYLGDEKTWTSFSKSWREALDAEGLEEYHATDTSSTRPEDVERQEKFLNIITSHRLSAIGVGIILKPYQELITRIKEYRQIPPGGKVSGSVADPYFLAFQHAIELAATNTQVNDLPPENTISFMFDDHRQFKGRALAVYESMLQSKKLDFVSRFKSISFGDSRTVLPLQAGDILSYEYFRELSDRYLDGKPGRWQWNHLTKSVPNEQLRLMDKGQLDSYLDILERSKTPQP